MVAAVLPNCVSRESRNEIQRRIRVPGRWERGRYTPPHLVTVTWVQLFCANCGCDGPYVVKQHVAPGQVGNPTFAFYLCDAKVNGCFEKWGGQAGMMAIPDELFWAEAHAAMLAEYGRVLEAPEVELLVQDPTSLISKLVKHRHQSRKFTGG